MKRKIILFSIALVMIFIFGACSGSQTAKEAESSVTKSTAQAGEVTNKPAPEGEKFENEKFAVTIAKGWESMDIDGGVQIYKNSGEGVRIYFRGSNMSDTESKSQSESLAKQYGGEAPKKVEKWGKEFWMTTYTAMDLEQLSYLRIEDGVMLSVGAASKDIKNNKDIMAMLESITFKD